MKHAHSALAPFLVCLALCSPGLVSAKPPKAAKPSSAAPPSPPAPAAESSNEPAAAPAPEVAPPTAASAKPAEPAAEPEPAAKPDPAPAADSGKLASLRSDVAGLVDELVEARSRAALLGQTLFKTQLRVKVQNLAAPDPVLGKLVLKLDGAPIFRGDGAALSGDDARQVFQGFVAPGAHVLAAELEQSSRDDAKFGYALHETYRFQAVRDKRSELTLIVDDDSDVPNDGDGEYDVRIKLRVRTKALNED
jgi:hypothetical protein